MIILKIILQNQGNSVTIFILLLVCQSVSLVQLFANLVSANLLCPWDSPGKNTGVGCHSLLQGIFLTQGSNLCLLNLFHCQVDSLPLCHLGRPLQRLQSNQIRFVSLAFWKVHKTMSQKDNEFDSHFYFVMLWGNHFICLRLGFTPAE